MTIKIAFLGLGAMGSRMARRLSDTGYAVTVWNRTEARAHSILAAGARWAETPREAARGQEVVISMVRADEASRALWLDTETGALAELGRDAVAIESSTLTPQWTRTLAVSLAGAGVGLLDAPVVGSRAQSEAGQLIYLVGGEAKTLEQLRSVLEAMGGAIHHAGPIGAGMVMKLAINGMFAIQVAALGELLGMTRRAGMKDERAMDIFASTPVISPAVKGAGDLMVQRAYDPLFPVELVEKDLGYVEAEGVDVPVTAAARAAYGRAIHESMGGLNIVAVARVYGA